MDVSIERAFYACVDHVYEEQHPFPLAHLHIEAKPQLPPPRKWHFEIHFRNENSWISINISLKFVHKGPIDNKLALV